MEPLTALGLAAAVVQFTDFGVRLLTDSVRIYQSVDGQTLQHVQLARISDDLSQLARNIEEKAVNLTQARRSLRPTERILVRLSEESQSISNQLSSILDRIRIDRSSNSRIDLARESIFAALRSYR
ncbi:hypothetical protein QBC43DRAFT_292730 [Cladorrhinum sp. PSN259]|nr:hypothetical protein QBC43DRAFT_292730 [Cladorrhinum sp. PSN259]